MITLDAEKSAQLVERLNDPMNQFGLGLACRWFEATHRPSPISDDELTAAKSAIACRITQLRAEMTRLYDALKQQEAAFDEQLALEGATS